MVGGEIFSEPQGPENLQNRSQPGQRPSLVIGGIATRQPVSHAGERLVEKGKCRLGAVQAVGPAAKCRRIGHAIRICERRRCLFPGAVLHQAPPQGLTACQQTVVRVRERKTREKGEGPPTNGAATATDTNPVVMFIVRLLAAASMADDRIALTNRASPQDYFGAVRRPIRFELVRRDGKWDKQNRRSLGLCSSGPDLPRSQPGKPSSFLLKQKSNWKRITLLACSFYGRDSEYWPVMSTTRK
jgi:hypothetical protein